MASRGLSPPAGYAPESRNRKIQQNLFELILSRKVRREFAAQYLFRFICAQRFTKTERDEFSPTAQGG
jgi:hypothetical protein